MSKTQPLKGFRNPGLRAQTWIFFDLGMKECILAVVLITIIVISVFFPTPSFPVNPR